MQTIFATTLVILFVEYTAHQADGHCSNISYAVSSRYGVVLGEITEILREAKCCAEEAQRIKGCDKFLITARHPGKLKISASSTHYSCINKQNYRLNAKDTGYQKGNAGSWCANKLTLDQYVQVSLTKAHIFRGVVTQGRSQYFNQWTTQYRVYYSDDCVTFHTDGKIYSANWDRDTLVVRLFDTPLIGKCIRINPNQYHNHISMRFDIIGCEA